MSDAIPSTPGDGPQHLGASARNALLWGGGFTLLRDVAQFGVMLALVRLLSPADYGTAALAQAIIGLVSVVSFATFSGHALQMRNPDDIDWQAHFTLATVLNTVLAMLVLALAFALSLTARYVQVALPLAALAVVFLVEIPGTLRHRMLEANHDWKRFRLLLIIGTFLGLGAGLTVALLGGGVWALIVQPPMLGLPAAIDLLFIQRFRPDWTWSWARWRQTFRFGLDRIGSGVVGRGRALNEHMLLAGFYNLATLGVFTRAVGLATLLAGRIGTVAMMSLYPVITRAESGSARFQRLADLVLRGVVWVTVPAAAVLGFAADDIVTLLYGAKWTSVVPLLPLAATAVGFAGIITVLSSLLVANNDSRAALSLDMVAAVSGIAVAVVLIPFGARTYLAGLGAHGLAITVAAVVLLVRRGAITGSGVAGAFVPALVASAVGVATALALRNVVGANDSILVRLAADTIAFTAAYLATLRFAFAQPLAELLDVAPGGVILRKRLKLSGDLE